MDLQKAENLLSLLLIFAGVYAVGVGEHHEIVETISQCIWEFKVAALQLT